MASVSSPPEKGLQDGWIHSMCRMCLHGCGILVNVVNGVAVKIDPDPDNVDNLGGLCPRGNVGLAKHYDRSRVTKPLIRTNQEKHWEADPKWKEISMEEALNMVSEKLELIMKRDPRKQRYWTLAWPSGAFGAPNFFSTLGTSCGGGYHPVNGAFQGAFASIPDYKYCNYLLQFGSGDGFEGHLHLSGTARRVADARMRGMKLVVVEPRLGTAAAKADEWIPIRIGTDCAFVMSLMNVIVHELGQFDEEFLKQNTNAPYLIANGSLARDENGKTLVWDPVAKIACPHDDPKTDPALTGCYDVSGIGCRPAFQIFKEKLDDYSPERVSEITTIAPETTRRIAKELVHAAEIGRTIELEGRTFPYRPVAIQWYRGAQPGNRSFMDNFAYKMINALLGNIDMPGGHLGVPLGWSPFDWKNDCSVSRITEGQNGVLRPWLDELRMPVMYSGTSGRSNISECFTDGLEPGELTPEIIFQHEKFGLPKPDAIFAFSANPILNMPETTEAQKALQSMDLIATIDTQAFSETTLFSDIVFPDRTFLESWSLYTCEAPFVTGHTLRQPVVKPPVETMDGTDIITELSERIGILDKWNATLNEFLGLGKNPKYLLEKNKKYSSEEIIRRFASAFYGEVRDLEWFKKNGTSMRVKKPEELYFPYQGLRLPFYMDFLKDAGEDFDPLPEFKFDYSHEGNKEFDLIARTTFGTFYKDVASLSWVTEVTGNKPEVSSIWMNADTAKKRGIKTGDRIRVISKCSSMEGIAWLTEGLHPEAVMVSQGGGTHKRGRYSVASASFNELVTPELRKASGNYETTVRVKVEAVN
jgi:anaerobic selenocysteine-containing dehydrogenase